MKANTKKQLDDWAQHGTPPGDFVQYVLENKLKEAFMYADDDNAKDMKEIVSYVYNSLPSACQGSPEKMKLWYQYKHPETT